MRLLRETSCENFVRVRLSLRRSVNFGGTHALDGGAHVTKGSSPPAVVEFERLILFSSIASLYYSCVLYFCESLVYKCVIDYYFFFTVSFQRDNSWRIVIEWWSHQYGRRVSGFLRIVWSICMYHR